MENDPKIFSSPVKTIDFIRQSELSFKRLRPSVHIFDALWKSVVLILISNSSVRRNNFRDSHIIVDDLDVRCVSTPLTN